MSNLRSFILASFALLASLSALADRPLVSDTADAIPAGTCQIESGLTRDTARGTPALRNWDNLFSCGLAHDTQVAAGYARARSDGQTAQAFLVAGKTSLLMPQAGRTGWGVAYSLGALKAPGLSLRAEEIKVVGLATRELADGLLGHANLGWSHTRSDHKSSTLWSLGLETTSDFTMAADVFGDDHSRPSVSAGVGYLFGGGFSANLSAALQFDNPRVRTLGIGAKLVF